MDNNDIQQTSRQYVNTYLRELCRNSEQYEQMMKFFNYEYDPEAERKAIRQEGFEEGFREGFEEGFKEVCKEFIELVEKFLKDGLSVKEALAKRDWKRRRLSPMNSRHSAAAYEPTTLASLRSSPCCIYQEFCEEIIICQISSQCRT